MSETAEQIVEAYLGRMAAIRATGAATSEASFYDALQALLTKVGATLKPRVACNCQLRNQGAGHPDFDLYTATQDHAAAPVPGQNEMTQRGVVKFKGLADQTWITTRWRRCPGTASATNSS